MSTIGIDPGVSPAFAAWPAGVTWQIAAEGDGPARLAQIARAVHDWAQLSAPEDLQAVFIENPRARFVSLELYRVTGVLEATLINALRDRFPHEPTVFRLTPTEWKKAIGLKGNADKAAVYEWAAQPDLSQDEADALAIAYAGHEMLNRDNRGGA